MNLVKPIHLITLMDVVLLNETRQATHLLKFKWIPFFIVKNTLEKLAIEISDKLGNKTIDDLQNEYDKTYDIMHLQLIEVLHMGAIKELNLNARLNAWKIVAGQNINDFSNILEKIKEHTGIEIKTPEDFKRFEKYKRRIESKFRQNYPEKPEDEKPKDASFEDIIDSVLGYAGYNYDETMRLSAFVKIRSRAEEKIKKESLAREKNVRNK